MLRRATLPTPLIPLSRRCSAGPSGRVTLRERERERERESPERERERQRQREREWERARRGR